MDGSVCVRECVFMCEHSSSSQILVRAVCEIGEQLYVVGIIQL